MKTERAKEVACLTPDELRTLVTMMTDDELANFMLYFRLGILAFLEEIIRNERAALRVELTL